MIKAGTESYLDTVYITDDTGAAKTGLAYNTAGLTAYYVRNNDSAAHEITLATMTLGTWASGGFVEVDATNQPGVYQIGVPNAAIAAGASNVVIQFKGVASTVFTPLKIELYTDFAADVVKIGGVAQSATDLKDFADTGYDPATHKVQGVVTADTVTTLTNMPVSNLLLSTTVASISIDEVEITLTAGSTVNDAYKGQTVVLYDVNNSNYPSIRKITGYVGATKTITIDTGADFTVVNGDTVRIFIDGNGTDIGLIKTLAGANGGKIDEVVASIAEVDAALQTISVSFSAEELATLISGLTAGILSAPEISRLLAGTGSVTWPYYVLGPGNVPIPNARVFVYSNSGLSVLVAKGTTNDFGLITFYLDPGTYYFVVRATGFTFDLDTEVVS